MSKVLFVCGGGIGNIVQATPAIQLLISHKFCVDLKLNCNSSDDLKQIFKLPGIRNIYISERPVDNYDFQLTGPFCPGLKYKAKQFIKPLVSYAQHLPEARVYYSMVQQLGIKSPMGDARIMIGSGGMTPHLNTVAIYPGSKPDWAMKRWDQYDDLAKCFKRVIIVGTKDDIQSHGNPAWIKKSWNWPKHVRFCYDKSLGEISYTISQCRCFIGNDGGLTHIAAATGIQTFVIFGPSSDIKNKPYTKHTHVISKDIPCRPCQFSKDQQGQQIFGPNKSGCYNNMLCMTSLTTQDVLNVVYSQIPKLEI